MKTITAWTADGRGTVKRQIGEIGDAVLDDGNHCDRKETWTHDATTDKREEE